MRGCYDETETITEFTPTCILWCQRKRDTGILTRYDAQMHTVDQLLFLRHTRARARGGLDDVPPGEVGTRNAF